MRNRLIVFFLLVFFGSRCFAQQLEDTPAEIIYKRVDTISLQMQVVYPSHMEKDRYYPCMVFFFGGGWINGKITQFKPEADYFTKRGMVCFLVDYRVRSRQGTTPFDALKDAKSAVRFIREHAGIFHIDKNRVVASGGSAGGQLAAATALIDGYNESTDNLAVSAIPNALVLFNPVIDNGPGGYGFGRIGEAYKNFSPLHNIKKGAPPTVIFLGREDKLIPAATAEYYKTVMQKVGSRCELFLYDGAGHGFFNRPEYMKKTLVEADKFLNAIGILHQ